MHQKIWHLGGDWTNYTDCCVQNRDGSFTLVNENVNFSFRYRQLKTLNTTNYQEQLQPSGYGKGLSHILLQSLIPNGTEISHRYYPEQRLTECWNTPGKVPTF